MSRMGDAQVSRLAGAFLLAFVLAACAPSAPTASAVAPVAGTATATATATSAPAALIHYACGDAPSFDCLDVLWRASWHRVDGSHIESMAAAPVDPARVPRPSAGLSSSPRAIYAVRIVLAGSGEQVTGVFEMAADGVFQSVSAPGVQPPEIGAAFATLDCGPYASAQEACVGQAWAGVLFSPDQTIRPAAVRIAYDRASPLCGSQRFAGCDMVTFTFGGNKAPLVVPVVPEEGGGAS